MHTCTCKHVKYQRHTKPLSLTFTLNVPSCWNDLPTQSSSWVLSHLQESAKNISPPSLFDPLTLALSILILFFKKKTNTSFSNLFAFYLFVFFLFIIQLTKAKKASNTSLLYSFSKKNKPCYVYCVKLTETCYSTCISLLFWWFWLLPLSSFVSRFG